MQRERKLDKNPLPTHLASVNQNPLSEERSLFGSELLKMMITYEHDVVNITTY